MGIESQADAIMEAYNEECDACEAQGKDAPTLDAFRAKILNGSGGMTESDIPDEIPF